MEQEKSKFSFSSATYTAIISMTFTIIGSLSIAYLNQTKPTLEYEILPISSFQADSSQITIVNIRIRNSGNKECENISFAPRFGDSLKNVNYTFHNSSSPIQILKIYDSSNHQTYYSIPYLNPKEQLVCSFLFKRIINPNEISIDLRSKGTIAVETRQEPSPAITEVLFYGTISMLVFTLALVVFIIFHQRKVIRFQLVLQRRTSQRIAATKQVIAAHGLEWDSIKDEVATVQKSLLTNSDEY
jgi:hypothetical protein